jgi:uncharacterized protein (TIGR02186 family)
VRAIALAALVAFGAAPSRAAEIAIGLTEELIEVDAGFAGAKVVLFGALTGAEPEGEAPQRDIVAVVRGPAMDFTLRRMQRDRMIWTPGPAMLIDDAPGVLVTTSTRPITEFATPELRHELQLDAGALDFSPLIEPTGPRSTRLLAERGPEIYSDAFRAMAQKTGRFEEFAGAVTFKKGTLFAINVELPPTTPVGEYAVEVFLIEDGELRSRDSATLALRKVGFERQIFELADERPIAYGIACVAISLLAGWLGAAAFRKRA